MNFKIVEGDTLMQHKDEFIILYNDPSIAVKDIPNLLDISHANMQRLRKICKEEGKIRLRPNRNKTAWEKKHFKPRWYGASRRGEKIYWQIKKKGVYYGYVHTVVQAKEMVRRLKECNWDKSKAKEIRDFVVENY